MRVTRRGGDRHAPILKLTELYYALRFGLDRGLESDFKRELARYADGLRSEPSGPGAEPQPS